MTIFLKRCFILQLALLLMVFQACKKENAKEIVIEKSSLTDIDGNTYVSVKIGEQWWMAENLKVTRYNNGDSLKFVHADSSSLWEANINGYYSSINDTIYGHLYNFAALADSRKLAPEGWHIPSDEEWKTLEKTIGMSSQQADALGWRGTIEAEKLMNKALSGWPQASLAFGSDLYGFAVLPGGCRIHNGYINSSSNTAFFWSSSSEGTNAWYRYLDSQKKTIFRQKTYDSYGMSIRCVKD